MDADGDPEKYLFSPQDGRRLANIEKRQKRKSKVQPSQICRAKKHLPKVPGEYYQVSSYRRALYQGAKKLVSSNGLPTNFAIPVPRKFGKNTAWKRLKSYLDTPKPT
jgi:hypothetical protein